MKIKKQIEITKNEITMREVIKFFKTGKWMSCPELIQRLIDKNAWKPATVNNFFQKSHTFTGGGKLQNIITTSRDNMIEELENQNLKTLDDDAEEEIQKTLDLLNSKKYKDVDQFIIDCQSRLAEAWIKFFEEDDYENACKYKNDITFQLANNEEETISDFYFMDLSSEQQQLFLDIEISHSCVSKASINDISNLVVELNSGTPWTTANKIWLEWLSALKFRVKEEIIENCNLKDVMNTISSSSAKYDWNKGGFVNLIFQTFYIVKHFDSRSKRYVPSPEVLRKWTSNKTDYITYINPDNNEYKVAKLIFSKLSYLLMLDETQRFKEYKSLKNLIIYFNLLFNKGSDTGQRLLEKTFDKSFDRKKHFIIVPNEVGLQRRFIELFYKNEVKLLNKNVYHDDGEPNWNSYNYVTQKDALGFKDTHIEIISKNFISFVKKLRNEGCITIVEKRAYKDSLRIAVNSEGMEDSFNQEVPFNHLIDSDLYIDGHKKGLRDGGDNSISNLKKESKRANSSHGARSI